MPRLGFTGDVTLGRKVDERYRDGHRSTGTGPDEAAARDPAVVELGAGASADDPDPLRVALVSATDDAPEFAAGPDSPGTAYPDLDDEAAARGTMADALASAREPRATCARRYIHFPTVFSRGSD